MLYLGDLILPDRVLQGGGLLVRDGRFVAVGVADEVRRAAAPSEPIHEVKQGFLSPGFVDLHVHGGDRADFMDATREAFATVLAAHARHGTTSIVPTTTVATHQRLLSVLELCRQFQGIAPSPGSRVLGAHFYGPYFHRDACGCHPAAALRLPSPAEYEQYLGYADAMVTATVAPELPGAEQFVRACCARGVRTNVGHSQATFPQMSAAVSWGVRHVDHLYCAMSDKTKLRQKQPYPMQGGVLEATLYFDELTTEVIADGKHLSGDLLNLALKIKGPDRLALVTDCNRALDCPEGRYIFGPIDEGEPFEHRDGVGIMPDGQSLASAAKGMDHMVRTFAELTGRPIWEVVRMATLTPARIAGWEQEIGSLEVRKRADFLILSQQLEIAATYVDGRPICGSAVPS